MSKNVFFWKSAVISLFGGAVKFVPYNFHVYFEYCIPSKLYGIKWKKILIPMAHEITHELNAQ